MTTNKPYHYYGISFVRPSDQKAALVGDKQSVKKLDGNEIKEFYEQLVSTNDDQINNVIKKSVKDFKSLHSIVDTNKVITRNVTKRDHRVNDYRVDSIFKLCQNGDFEGCQRWLQLGYDINTRDHYMWTPLMCSACAGHQSIVELLLDNNADISAKDKKGSDVLHLAIINGHNHIYDLIVNHLNKSDNYDANDDKDCEPLDEQTETIGKGCDICHQRYNGCDIRHNSSIVHQIHTESSEQLKRYYEIPENNRGFQMLLRSGWTRDKGLGPEGSGNKSLIKTVLKRDRLGLGLSGGSDRRNKCRVTHFKAYDTKSVDNHMNKSKTSKIQGRKQSSNRLKQIEINFRQQFK